MVNPENFQFFKCSWKTFSYYFLWLKNIISDSSSKEIQPLSRHFNISVNLNFWNFLCFYKNWNPEMSQYRWDLLIIRKLSFITNKLFLLVVFTGHLKNRKKNSFKNPKYHHLKLWKVFSDLPKDTDFWCLFRVTKKSMTILLRSKTKETRRLYAWVYSSFSDINSVESP